MIAMGNLKLALAALVGVLIASGSFADDKPAVPDFTYRAIGLFLPSCEKDFRDVLEKETPEITVVKFDIDEGEVTLAFDPKKLFPTAKPEQVVDRLNLKLSLASRNIFGVKPRRTIPRDKLKQVVIPIAGLDCKACCLAAYEAVSKIDGVEQATASFKDRRLAALIDPSKTSQEALEEALRKKNIPFGKP
jgi:copper chaperone CopZ